MRIYRKVKISFGERGKWFRRKELILYGTKYNINKWLRLGLARGFKEASQMILDNKIKVSNKKRIFKDCINKRKC